jgi:hypothetical protein
MDAGALYSAAIEAMSKANEATYVAYRLEGRSDTGLDIRLSVEEDGSVWLRSTRGSAPAVWSILHRSRDFESAIVDQSGGRYVSNRSFFDPTWYGAFHALHDGMFFWNRRAQPVPQGITRPDTLVGPGEGALATIAVVRAMGSQIYIVRDDGDARCSNGDPGRALGITARASPVIHQLTAAIVDLRTTQFCMLRFTEDETLRGLAFPGRFSVEQHYDSVGGYWVQTGGVVDFDEPMEPFGTSLSSWRYRLLDMTFPQTIPDDMFASRPLEATPKP